MAGKDDCGGGAAEKEVRKVFRWFTSIMAERAWLEEQSMEGWMLRDIQKGVRYVFEKEAPVHMVYDAARFDLPKNPTRREIEEKIDLVNMAEETGWKIICHDEGQNYYLTRPWNEGEPNELYDSREDRERRAAQYRRLFTDKMQMMLWINLSMMVLGILVCMIPGTEEVGWFPLFLMFYTIFCLIVCLITLRLGRRYEREMRLSLEEWRVMYGKKDTVTVRKPVLTVGGLERFLAKKAAEGYHIKNMRIYRFVFTKGEPGAYIYMMDTKYLTNQRRKQEGNSVFRDSRDWSGGNNDWQVQSLRDAEAAGWEFVGAVENRNILYRAKADSGAVRLNRSGGLRIVSAFGGMAVSLVICGLIGGIIGGLVGFFLG